MNPVRLIALHAVVAALIGVAPARARQVSVIQRNYTIVVDEGLVVRRMHPPSLFDEKGKPRKPTAEELRTMKGSDTRLKGYKAEKSDLKAGQVVIVTLAQTKSSPSQPKPDSGKSSEAEQTKPKKPVYKILGDYAGRLVRAPVTKAPSKHDKVDADQKETLVVGLDALRLPGQPAPAPRDKTRLPPTIFVVRIVIVKGE